MVDDSRVTGMRKKSGVIRKYGLNMSRQAFREHAEAIGFHKVSFWVRGPAAGCDGTLGACLIWMLMRDGLCSSADLVSHHQMEELSKLVLVLDHSGYGDQICR